jgi:hypothetical protein
MYVEIPSGYRGLSRHLKRSYHHISNTRYGRSRALYGAYAAEGIEDVSQAHADSRHLVRP